MNRCLIFLDNDNIQNSIDLLEVANRIYDAKEYETIGISINHLCEDAIGKFDVIIHVNDKNIHDYHQVVITDIVEKLHKEYSFDSILIPATYYGRMFAPRLSMRLHAGLVADVTEIHNDGEKLEMVRPAFNGKIMAGIIKQGEGPIMMSVRQNVFTYTEEQIKKTTIRNYEPNVINKSKMKLLSVQVKSQSLDIRESEVLISGGGGTLEKFDHLDLLAKEMNAQVSASRRIVDSGIASRNIQVGQSGKTVSPKLYIALGISGSTQHIEGLKNVKDIISVNTNRHAPICSLSDMVIEGDAIEFVSKLVNKIKSEKIYNIEEINK